MTTVNRENTLAPSSTSPSAVVQCGKFNWPIDKDDYVLEATIGSGATSIVHSALCKSKNTRVAIKRIELEKCSCGLEEMQKEIQAMSMCNHENVTSYYASFVHGSELWIVMRLLDAGSVLDLLHHTMECRIVDRFDGVLDEIVIATILREVLKGLSYFHQNGQIHRDVKSGNILMGMDGTVQIADFGVSSAIIDCDDRLDTKSRRTFVGTPCWMAPEIMEHSRGYNFKVDIWSLGITALEMAAGYAPYAKYPAMKVLMLTIQNEPPTLETCAEDHPTAFKKYSKAFRKMITECLKKDPQLRPDAKNLIKNKFFKAAKGKDFLSEFLRSNQLNIKERSNKVVKKLDSSGRFETSNEEWIFPDDNSAKSPTLSNPSIPNTTSPQEQVTKPKDTTKKPPRKYNIIFRIRNKNNDLNEIAFEFDTTQDTCLGIAEELISADLITGQNRITVAANLEKILDSDQPNKKIVFALSKNNSTSIADEDQLVGYAQLCLESFQDL